MIGTTKGTYYVGERDHTIENLDVVRRCVAADGVRVVNRIVEISHAGRAPKQDPCIAAFDWESINVDSQADWCATMEMFSGHLVSPDERIVLADDLRVILKKALESPNPTRESDAAYDRLLAAIGTPTVEGTES